MYVLNDPVSFIDRQGLDVTISAYAGLDFNPFGHVGVSVNDSTSEGFDPNLVIPGSTAIMYMGMSVFGVEDPVAANRQATDSITIHTTHGQDQAILSYLLKHQAGLYNLYSNNCATFAENALRSAGLEAPFDMTPGSLLNDLHAMYDLPTAGPVSVTSVKPKQ